MSILILIGFAGRCGATVYYSDGSAANVQFIHDTLAVNGDTITLPGGAFIWANGVTIRKGITLQGVADATQITRGAGYTNALITITGFSADLPVRVTGIRFNSPVGQNGDLYSIYVVGPYGGTWGLTQLRIDNCYFYGGQRTLFFRFRVNGVADHNTFQDCAYAFAANGDDDYAWERAGSPSFGTSDSFFLEDNTLLFDNAITYFDVISDINTGAKQVWRYNTFDSTAFTGIFGSLIESHGNQAYWHGGYTDWLRGGVMTEVYNNTFHWSSAFRIMWFRGGRNIVANNTFFGGFGGKIVAFDEEEGIPVFFNPIRTIWPAEDQVNNTFVFGNTLNGSPVAASIIGNWQPGSNPLNQVNRDFWLQAPSASTVTTYPHPGSPSVPGYPLPYNPPVTSWTPYTYPHPLVTGGIPSPTPTPSATATPTGTPRTTPTPTASPSPTPTATATATSTPTATPAPIDLVAQIQRIGGINTTHVKWKGAASANIDVYRNGVVIATTPNDQLYDDSTGTSGQARFTYKVCEARTQTCSDMMAVNFPP